MSVTHTWSIENMTRSVSDGGVQTVEYSVTGVDGDYNFTAYSTVNFTPNPDEENFIEYEDLTEDVVIGWVKNSLGSDIVSATEDYVSQKINIQKAPVIAEGKPWS